MKALLAALLIFSPLMLLPFASAEPLQTGGPTVAPPRTISQTSQTFCYGGNPLAPADYDAHGVEIFVGPSPHDNQYETFPSCVTVTEFWDVSDPEEPIFLWIQISVDDGAQADINIDGMCDAEGKPGTEPPAGNVSGKLKFDIDVSSGTDVDVDVEACDDGDPSTSDITPRGSVDIKGFGNDVTVTGDGPKVVVDAPGILNDAVLIGPFNSPHQVNN